MQENNEGQVYTPVETVAPGIKPPEDLHGIIVDYTELKQYVLEEMNSDKLAGMALPNIVVSKIAKMIEYLNSVNGKDDNERTQNWLARFREYFGPKALLTLLDVYSRSSETSQAEDIFKAALNHPENRYVNDLVYGEKHLNILTPPSPKTGGTLAGNNALARFTSILSIGDIKQIPLYHSGFWLTITPPKQAAIVNLERAMGREQLRAGRETNTIVYSNYGVIINRIMTDFIMNHVIDSSLDVPLDKLTDYISVHDLQTLALGMISAMYPNGFETDKFCVNTLVTAPGTNQAMCSFFAKAKVNPANLSWKNGTMFNNAMLLTLSKRKPNCVSVEEIKQYANYLEPISNKTVNVTSSNGKVITVTFKVPTLAEHLIAGDAWINSIIKQTEEIFTAADTKEVKDNKVYAVITSVLLALFNTFVSKIEIDDVNGHIVVDDKLTVTTLLETLSDDDALADTLFTEIKTFISSSILATVATPNFICPECSKNQNEDAITNEAFKELIPINITEVFFGLSAIRLQKMLLKNIS